MCWLLLPLQAGSVFVLALMIAILVGGGIAYYIYGDARRRPATDERLWAGGAFVVTLVFLPAGVFVLLIYLAATRLE
jgi:Trk-type K+ transport system membrane component